MEGSGCKPQTLRFSKSAHIRQPGPDSGLGFPVRVMIFQEVASSLGIGGCIFFFFFTLVTGSRRWVYAWEWETRMRIAGYLARYFSSHTQDSLVEGFGFQVSSFKIQGYPRVQGRGLGS